MIAVESLRHMLADDLEHVARAYLTNVKLERSGELRGDDRNGERWAVQLRGPKRGVCLNTSSLKGANAFDFLRQAAGGGTVQETCRLAESVLGLAEGGQEHIARQLARVRAHRATAEREREQADQRRVADVAARAREWRDAAPIGTDTPAASYLEGRRCRTDDADEGLRSATGPRGATMLAALRDVSGRVLAYHETALRPGRDGWRKRSPKAKLVWGPAGGCLIRLAAGPDHTLVLSEGIEDGLTAHLLLPELAAAAAYSVGNLRAPLPDAVRRVVLVRDREDNPRSHGPACRAAAILQWWQQGRAVTCLDPPDGFADLNAAAQQAGGQRNGHKLPAAEVWAAAQPLEAVPEAAAWCAAHGLAGPHLLRAHPALEAGGRTYPGVLARMLAPDGHARGLVARLIGADLFHPWREWGSRHGAAVAVRAHRPGAPGCLAVGLERALAGGAAWAVLGNDHLAETALAPSVWSLTVLGQPPAGRWSDDTMLWREGMRRLHPGRELTVVAAEREADHAAAA
jgi:hypothetical protein